MDCDGARISISARVDGELDPTEGGHLDHHLISCPTCQRWESRVYALRRSVVMRQEGAPAELADRVLAGLNVPIVGAGQWVRYALGVVAAAIVVLHLPQLLSLAGGGSGHEARHLGTFGVALGVGLLWAAIRPERAIGLVPLSLALAAATLVGAVIDLGAGTTAAAAESSHLLELVGLVLLWMLSAGPARLRRQLAALRPQHRPRAA
jgi:predicted anti-sigma-YlaC factor YlaD